MVGSLALAQASGASDPMIWRQYLSPSDWKKYSNTISNYTMGVAFSALHKTACHVDLGIDGEDRFLDLLTGPKLLRNGVESEDQKKKYRAWRFLLGKGPADKCDTKKLAEDMEIKQRWYSELLDLQVVGFKNMMNGGRMYR